MQLYSRDKFLELPVGTVFQRFYPELITADYGADDIHPRPFVDLCIKGQTDGRNFTFSSLTDCIHCDAHPDHLERDHMALCHGATESHFALDVEATALDVSGGHSEPTLEFGREVPPRMLFAVWSIDEVDALITRLKSANDHARNALGLEI